MKFKYPKRASLFSKRERDYLTHKGKITHITHTKGERGILRSSPSKNYAVVLNGRIRETALMMVWGLKQLLRERPDLLEEEDMQLLAWRITKQYGTLQEQTEKELLAELEKEGKVK